MSDEQAKQAKQHDLEESPRDTARRLTIKTGRALQTAFVKDREKLRRHGRYLADEDRHEHMACLERELEVTRTILDGAGEVPPLSYSSEVLDHLEP